jgi:hypothetical protein
MNLDHLKPLGHGPVVKCGKEFVGGWEYLILALKVNEDYNGDEEQLLNDARTLQKEVAQKYPHPQSSGAYTS